MGEDIATRDDVQTGRNGLPLPMAFASTVPYRVPFLTFLTIFSDPHTGSQRSKIKDFCGIEF